MLSAGGRWQPHGAASQGAGGGREETGRGLLGGEERCEAKVRQMVADNEDVGGGQAGLQLGAPRKHVALGGGKGARGRDGAAPTALAQEPRVTFSKNS